MSWFQRLLCNRRMEKELDAELRFHFELLVTEKVRLGMAEEEAQRRARLEFGGLEQGKRNAVKNEAPCGSHRSFRIFTSQCDSYGIRLALRS